MSDKRRELVIYSSPSCGVCKKLVKELRRKEDIKIDERDIKEVGEDKKEEIVEEAGHLAVPAIEEDGEIIQVGV